jgi:hypothetical protein
MTMHNLVPSNNAYREGWSKWVLCKTEERIYLTDHMQNLTADYWACKKAFTAGWHEGQRCIDE